MPKALFGALIELAKSSLTLDDLTEFHAEALAENNDRGAAIILAADVENALDSVLTSRLVRKRTSLLFGPDKPFGSFRNKVVMAYAMNICGERAYRNLEIIRHIRNAFAHAKTPIRFTTKEVTDLCAVMEIPIPVTNSILIPMEISQDMSAREIYGHVCNRLSFNLAMLPFVKPKSPIMLNDGALDMGRIDEELSLAALTPPLP